MSPSAWSWSAEALVPLALAAVYVGVVPGLVRARALAFEVRFWPEQFETWVAVASDVRETILRELGRAGIAIPYPQRDLHVRTAPPARADLRTVALLGAADPATRIPPDGERR